MQCVKPVFHTCTVNYLGRGQQLSASSIVVASVARQPSLICFLGNFVLMPHAANLFTDYDLNIARFDVESAAMQHVLSQQF